MKVVQSPCGLHFLDIQLQWVDMGIQNKQTSALRDLSRLPYDFPLRPSTFWAVATSAEIPLLWPWGPAHCLLHVFFSWEWGSPIHQFHCGQPGTWEQLNQALVTTVSNFIWPQSLSPCVKWTWYDPQRQRLKRASGWNNFCMSGRCKPIHTWHVFIVSYNIWYAPIL